MRESDLIRIIHQIIGESPRIASLEARVGGLEARVGGLETAVHRLGILMEEHQTKLDRLSDAVLALAEAVAGLKGLELLIQRLTDRHDAVEDGLRRHVRNRRVHRSVSTAKAGLGQ